MVLIFTRISIHLLHLEQKKMEILFNGNSSLKKEPDVRSFFVTNKSTIFFFKIIRNKT